jgi:hypothetical protein
VAPAVVRALRAGRRAATRGKDIVGRVTTATMMTMALAALAIAGCGGSSSAPTDAAPAADRPADTAAAGCDPAAQDCPAGSKCDFGCEATAAVVSCRADNDGGALGSSCAAAMPCAKGTGCLTTPDAGSACRKYCAGDGDCLASERCHNVSVTVACGGTSPPLALHICY